MAEASRPESPRAEGRVWRAPVPELPRLHMLVLPTPWQVGPVQVYLIEGDPPTLIDTGVKSRASRAALEAGLETFGLELADVGRVILTHAHGDHLGQAQSLRDAGAELEVWVHERDAPLVEDFRLERVDRVDEVDALFREHGVPEELLARQREARMRVFAEEAPLAESTRVDRRLRGGERLDFKDFELVVLEAPGHTEGHILLFEERSGTMLTGDHVMGSAVPFTVTYRTGDAADPDDPLGRPPRFRGLACYLRSLHRLRKEPLRTLLPAHGGRIERPARAIDDAILFYEVRIQRVERALRRLAAHGRCATAWQLWRELFPKADPIHQMRKRMQMVIGCLDLLEERGVALPERRADGCVAYRHRSRPRGVA